MSKYNGSNRGPKRAASGPRWTSIETIIGMEARQAIQAGEIVFADQVQSPVLVKKGDLITVVSQNGGIRVRTSAQGAAGRGEWRFGASRVH